MKDVNLSYVTLHDAQNVHNFSGTEYHIAKALEKRISHINYIGNLRQQMGLYDHFLRRFFLTCSRSTNNFLNERALSVARNYARQVASRISPDTAVIFSTSSIPISLLDTTRKGMKKVFYTDATFAAMIDYYPEFTNLGSFAIKQGHFLEKKALESCDLAIYASEWAAESAISDYQTDSAKVKIVPRGAGIETMRMREEVEKIIQEKSKDTCNLLFIGIDWQRKGGGIALDTAKLLHDKGVKVHLDIVGALSLPKDLPAYVTHHPFISKSTEAGRKTMDALFSKAHFFILPTRAECMGIVFCEASSFGLPSLATRTGGISSAIRDGINGKLFHLSDDAFQYAGYIEKSLSDFANYQKMCFASFDEYEKRLNWDVAGEKIIALIEEII